MADLNGAELTGQQLGEYRVLRRLGAGGMAEVYLAEQKSLGRKVALKVLQSKLADDATYVQRFANEARAAASLVHPHIVQIYEVGHVDGVHYLSQEYVAGKNLSQLLKRRGSLAPGMVLDVLRQVASALARAAEQGIVHRDIKPENLLLSGTGEVKVADFGLARVIDADATTLTQAGIAMGTPLYMSPEQIEARAVDIRSDLYSLGVTAYHLLAGAPPHQGETALAIAVQHLNVQPKPLTEVCPEVPRGLARVIGRLMAKAVDKRFQSPRELLSELKQLGQQAAEQEWEGLSARSDDDWPSSGTLRGLSAEDVDGEWEESATPSRATYLLEGLMEQEAKLEETTLAEGGKKRKLSLALVVGSLLVGTMLARATRQPNYLRGRSPSSVEKKDDAWAQIYHANRAPSESAWLAVRQNFAEADPYLHTLADQGLVRYYLLLSDESEKALRVLKRLADASDQPDASPTLKAFTQASLAIAFKNEGEETKAREAAARITTEMRDQLRASEPRLAQLLAETLR